MRTTWFIRLLNRVGLRHDTLICMCQADTWCWTERLGKMTEGKCDKCGIPIYYEIQNKPFRKICNRCAYHLTPLAHWWARGENRELNFL
jgi:hypothetical protein